MTSALKAKVKSAATLLQQRKLLQRNLRSLQQHSLSREILSNYRSRLHALPPAEVVKSMSPFVNERMRKRRCFADKELEMVMLERERQTELSKQQLAIQHAHRQILMGANPQQCPQSQFDAAKSRLLLGNMTPRDFLQRVFPTHNPNLLELVWQGCGGNLERAIEQLASGLKTASPILPSFRSNLSHSTIAMSQGVSSTPNFPTSHLSPSSSVSDPTNPAKLFNVYPLVFPNPIMLPHAINSSNKTSKLDSDEDTEHLRAQSSDQVSPASRVSERDDPRQSASNSPLPHQAGVSFTPNSPTDGVGQPSSPQSPRLFSSPTASSPTSSLASSPLSSPFETRQIHEKSFSQPWRGNKDSLPETELNSQNLPCSSRSRQAHSTPVKFLSRLQNSMDLGRQDDGRTGSPVTRVEKNLQQTHPVKPYLKFSVEAIMGRT